MPILQDISNQLKSLFSWLKNNEEFQIFSPVPFPELWVKYYRNASSSLLNVQFHEITTDLSKPRFKNYNDIVEEKTATHHGIFIPDLCKCWNIKPETIVTKLHLSLDKIDYVIQNSKRVEGGKKPSKSIWHFYYKPNAYKAATPAFTSYGNIKIELSLSSNKNSLKIINTYYQGHAYKQTQNLELLLGKLLGRSE